MMIMAMMMMMMTTLMMTRMYDDDGDDDDDDDNDDDSDEKDVRVDLTCGRENDFEIYLCHIEGSEAQSKGALQLGQM